MTSLNFHKPVFHEVRDSDGKVEFYVSADLRDPHSGGMIMLRAEKKEPE